MKHRRADPRADPAVRRARHADRRRCGGRLRRRAAVEGRQVAEPTSRRRSPTPSSSSADRASKMAGYYRRAEDYVLQANLATSELEQYGRQIISSLLREQIAQARVREPAAGRSRAPRRSRRSCATSSPTRSSTPGCRASSRRPTTSCYKLAFDVAKRAEQTLKHELMRPEFDQLDIIKFGYWDAGAQGPAGRRDAVAWTSSAWSSPTSSRTAASTSSRKHVSLARLDPIALLQAEGDRRLRGRPCPSGCSTSTAPGQYMRRLKTVAVSIPARHRPVHRRALQAVAAAHRSCASRHSRATSTRATTAPTTTASATSRERSSRWCTSSAQNDSGLFELNLRDERPLPFEGAGAISTWRIELPNDVPQFDFESDLRRRPAPALHRPRSRPPARRGRHARQGGHPPGPRQPAAALRAQLRLR